MAVGAAGWAVMVVPSLCTFRFFTAVLLVNIAVYKKKKNTCCAQSLNCLRLGCAEWNWWSPLGLICALGFVNSTVLSSWLFFHIDVSDQGITQLKNCALSVNLSSFQCRYLLPTKPFLVHFRSSRIMIYNVLCCGYFIVLQKKLKICCLGC